MKEKKYLKLINWRKDGCQERASACSGCTLLQMKTSPLHSFESHRKHFTILGKSICYKLCQTHELQSGNCSDRLSWVHVAQQNQLTKGEHTCSTQKCNKFSAEPERFARVTLAPFASKRRTMSSWPIAAASIRGVIPSPFSASTSKPAAKHTFKHGRLLLITAQWRGVPSPLQRSSGPGFASRSF
jgi:hypothetical protein